ncbi:MAG: hypothetical protein U0T82_09170 [Bacteroidales bacterium]
MSVVFLVLFSIAFVTYNQSDLITLSSTLVYSFSLMTTTALFFIKYREHLKKRRVWLLGIITTILFVPGFLLMAYAIDQENYFLLVIAYLFISLFLSFVIMRLFLFNEDSLLGIAIAMVLICVGILMKKMHLPLAGFLITICCIPMALGMFTSGIFNFLTIKNNRFLRNATFIADLLLSMAFLGLLFKMQHWPMAGLFIMLSQIPILLATLFFILLLPRSDYFEWSKPEKRILSRTLIPWVFFLVLISRVYLNPKGMSFIFYNTKIPPPSYYQYYQPEPKNGLSPGL